MCFGIKRNRREDKSVQKNTVYGLELYHFRVVGTPKTTYNSQTAHGTATKPGRLTVLRMPVRNLEDHGGKPSVTKLASVLHTRL